MSRTINLAFLFVLFFSFVCGLLLMAFIIGRDYQIKFYPRYIVPLATLSPLLFPIFLAKCLHEEKHMLLNLKEVLAFGTIVVVGCGAVAFVTEAAIVHAGLSQVNDISLYEILSAPFTERYSVVVLFGMSYFASSIMIVAYVAFIRLPLISHRRLKDAHFEATNSDDGKPRT